MQHVLEKVPKYVKRLVEKKKVRDFPGDPVFRIRLPMQEMRVQSLVQELKCHMWWSN